MRRDTAGLSNWRATVDLHGAFVVRLPVWRVQVEGVRVARRGLGVDGDQGGAVLQSHHPHLQQAFQRPGPEGVVASSAVSQVFLRGK
ncbi:hypothetical protein E2C01_073787 [Portunus trituberculatus]|uniref:Uncharacterized protein n=1 Tax=Portunus trituberculatus TaxID=210409 RepID=A0A5B7IBK1_PORTR|nr:hypothetical protein [Portunus trituberculatus]